MGWLLIFLLLSLVLFGLGFVVKVLWWVALVMLAVWIIGALAQRAGHRHHV